MEIKRVAESCKHNDEPSLFVFELDVERILSTCPPAIFRVLPQFLQNNS